MLGLPTTDESPAANNGRYNHFVGGSIYWARTRDRSMVNGLIQQCWENQGWERSSLAFPVQDPYTMYSADSKVKPTTSWSMFENGAILSCTDGASFALTAEIAPDDLKGLIRKQFDTQFHQSPDNIGLQAQVYRVSVSHWTYGFDKSGARHVTLRLYGFHDNGALLPDTNFTILMELGFGLVAPNQFLRSRPLKRLSWACILWSSTRRGREMRPGFPAAYTMESGTVFILLRDRWFRISPNGWKKIFGCADRGATGWGVHRS